MVDLLLPILIRVELLRLTGLCRHAHRGLLVERNACVGLYLSFSGHSTSGVLSRMALRTRLELGL